MDHTGIKGKFNFVLDVESGRVPVPQDIAGSLPRAANDADRPISTAQCSNNWDETGNDPLSASWGLFRRSITWRGRARIERLRAPVRHRDRNSHARRGPEQFDVAAIRGRMRTALHAGNRAYLARWKARVELLHLARDRQRGTRYIAAGIGRRTRLGEDRSLGCHCENGRRERRDESPRDYRARSCSRCWTTVSILTSGRIEAGEWLRLWCALATTVSGLLSTPNRGAAWRSDVRPGISLTVQRTSVADFAAGEIAYRDRENRRRSRLASSRRLRPQAHRRH